MSVLDRIFAGQVTQTGKHGWTGTSHYSTESSAGITVSPEKAMAFSAYYASLRNIAEDTGKLPFKTYRKLQPRGKRPLPDHPVYRCLQVRFNPEMSAQVGRELLTKWAVGWGNGIAEIVRGPGTIDMYPIHPSRMEIRRSEDGRLFYRIRNAGGWHVDIQSADIFHVRGLGDDVLGYSPALIGAESMGRALAAQEFSARFFKDGTTTTGVFKTADALNDQARERLRKSWPKGLPDAHRPLFLEGGLEWQQLSVNPDEAQMLETMQFTINDVARWFRMPPHKIQQLDKATFSNIEQQSLEYVGDTLMPWLRRWESEVAMKLFKPITEPDLFAEHVVMGLLRGDAAARSAYYRERFNTASLSPNDIRELENENPIGDEAADKYYLQSGMTTIDQIMQEPSAPAGPSTFGNEPSEEKGTDDATARAFTPLIVSVIDRIRIRERKAVETATRRCAGKPADFTAWSEKFHTEQNDMLARELYPCVEALVMLQCADNRSVRAVDVAQGRVRSVIVSEFTASTNAAEFAFEIIAIVAQSV